MIITLQRGNKEQGQKVSSNEEDEALLNELEHNPFSTCAEASSASGFPGSRQTAQRRIKESNLKCSAAVKKSLLTDEQKQARVIFAVIF